MSDRRTDERAPEGGARAAEEPPEIEIVSFGDEADESEPARPAGGTGTAAPAGAAVGDAGVREELEQERTRYLRLRADFENFRKRVDRERSEGARRAVGDALRELLPVVDNLERALAAGGEAEELRGGVELILRQLVEVMRRLGVAEIPALGLPFDPQIHEAVARVEDPAVAAPTVVAELQRGYWLQDRLLRPAMVRVAVPVEGDDAGPDADPAGRRGE